MELPTASNRAAALVGLAAVLAIPAAQGGPGRTAGYASVSPDGEASYLIPIALPPGTNGLTPVLSLDYRHRARGGLLGAGWSLGGLSQIARCARTVAQDGVAEPPGRFGTDRLCLDGQRLVVVSGAYGAVNAEYRTEIESFARIRSVGGSSAIGPAYFIVERPDGRIYEYGVTPDSSIDGVATAPAGSARSWALNRIRDRAGNVIDYRYTEDAGSLAFRIARIAYNANPSRGVGASHEVAFIYKDRPNREVDAGYVSGMPVQQVVRLDRIDVLYEGDVVRSYNLDYEAALSSGGRSRLARVRECGVGGTDCLAPTEFEWQDGGDGMSAVSAFSAQLPVMPTEPGFAWNLADVDGDGRHDYVYAGGADLQGATTRFRLSLAGGAFGPAVNTGNPARGGIGKPFDANGDGRTDLLTAANGRWAIAYGSPTGLSAATVTAIALPAGLRDYRGADMNGDGLGDIAWSEVPDPIGNRLTVRMRLARPGGGFGDPVTLYSQSQAVGYPQAEGGWFVGDPGRRIDLDGDGAEELLMNEEYSIARISDRQYATDRPDLIVRGGVPLDFNDDGCTDLAYKHMSSNTLRVRLSACSVAAPAVELLGGAWQGSYQPQALDWNGDGREDVLARGAVNWLVALSQGNAIAPFLDTGIPHEGAAAVSGRDLDGDGLADIALKTAGQIRARFRAGPAPDLLSAATDGFGVMARFTYSPLTDPAVYAAGETSDWPDPQVQTADLVVSELHTTDGTGAGGTIRAEYRYEGLRVNLQGRGPLGFRVVTRIEHADAKPRVSVLRRRQDFPFTGLPERAELLQSSGRKITSTEYLWSGLTLGAGPARRHFPFPSTMTTRHFGLGGFHDGAEITRTVRSIAAVDATSGVVTDETATTTETGGGLNAGSSVSLRTRHPALLNDVANWCLGRPEAVEVTASHTLPGGAPVTRRAEQSWSAPKCRPTRTLLFPGDDSLQVTYDYGYDGFGNITTEKVAAAGVAARSVSTQWGTRGRLPTRVTDPLGQSSRYAWDERLGLPRTFTDPNNLAVRWTYDAFGRPLSESWPDGSRTEWTRERCNASCDDRSRYRIRQDEVDAGGVTRATSWVEVDQHERGFRLATLEPGGGISIASADSGARGQVVRQYLPHWGGDQPPGHLAFVHDGLGRVITERLVAAGGSVERAVEHDYDGLSSAATDHAGRTQVVTRTAWGTIAEAIDAAGGRTRFDHDAFGHLIGVRDALGNAVATVTYDAQGRKTAVEDMDRGTWRWSLNALGEVTAVRDAKGQLTRYERDALGRITQRTTADGTATWTWGTSASNRNVGRLAAVSAPGYAEAFTYDAVGRPAAHTITSDAAYRFDFSYDALGLLDEFAYPAAGPAGRLRIRHEYEAGRVTRIRNGAGGGEDIWTLHAQDAAGRPLDESLGAGVRVVSGYSPLTGDLEYRQAGAGGGAAIQDLAYGWDSLGNLAWRRDFNQALIEEFRYDSLDRLLQSRRNGTVNLELDYDAIGNIRRKSDACPGPGACYAYDSSRRHAVVSAGGRSYAYDANGNMTSRDGSPVSWSADNLPVSISGPGGQSQFDYAPDGGRWRQVARQGSAVTTTSYAGGLFEKSVAGGSTTWRHYIPSPGGTVVQLRTDSGAAESRILTLDHLGSTDRVLDASGKVGATASFGAFGSRRGPAWTGLPSASDLEKLAAVTRDGFTGHEMLDNLGLIHMNGRVYDPLLGRFLSADPYVTRPFDGQGLNRYSYVLNNPLALVDPSGFDAVPCLATQSGNCVQIIVIAASWAHYMRAAGGSHASEVASALERDPCGQSGSGLACSMPVLPQTTPAGVVLTVGRQPGAALSTGGRLDAIQGFAARVANLAISSSPIALLFGADPDFQYFSEPRSGYGRAGALAGNFGYFAGGAVGIVRNVGNGVVARAPSEIARSFQGSIKYPNVDRFRDITLKKGSLIYAGYPGQGMFYTTASAMRRTGASATELWRGLQVAAHHRHLPRTRMAAFEVIEDTPAAFGLARANIDNGIGGLPQIVVPSYMTSLRFVNDFPLGP